MKRLETLKDLLENISKYDKGSKKENDFKHWIMGEEDKPITAAHLWYDDFDEKEKITGFRVWTKEKVYSSYWCALCNSVRVNFEWRYPFRVPKLEGIDYFKQFNLEKEEEI